MPFDPWSVFSADFGTVGKPYTAFVTLLDIAVYFWMIVNVGRARRAYKIDAPATDGPEAFQRVMRVQANTVEQMVMHLPLLWIAAFAMDDMFAAAFGAVWAFARIIYARGYYHKAKRRHKGFMIGLLVDMVLLVGAAAGTIASF
jgi:hypothetical protein